MRVAAGILALLCTIFINTPPSFARHEIEDYYTGLKSASTTKLLSEREKNYKLLVGEPFGVVQNQLDKEFWLMPFSELNEYLDRQELEQHEWPRLLPEFNRSFQAGAMAFAGNLFALTEERVKFLTDLKNLADSYAHPRLEASVKDKNIAFSLSKPPPLIQGARLGLSLDLENPTHPEEILSPVPYLKFGQWSFVGRLRYNVFRNTLKFSLENVGDELWGIKLSAFYQKDFGDGDQLGGVAVLKQIHTKKDIWLKLRFRVEDTHKPEDRLYLRESGWEIALFLFSNRFDVSGFLMSLFGK